MIDWDYLMNYTIDKVEDKCVRGGKVLYGRDLHTREIDRMLERNEEALYLTKNNVGDAYLITTNGMLVFTRNSRRELYYDFYRDQITFLDFQSRRGRFDSDVEIIIGFNRDNNLTISIDMYYEPIAKDIFYYFKDIKERQYSGNRPSHRDPVGQYDNRPSHRDSVGQYDNRPSHRDQIGQYDNRPSHRDSVGQYDNRPQGSSRQLDNNYQGQSDYSSRPQGHDNYNNQPSDRNYSSDRSQPSDRNSNYSNQPNNYNSPSNDKYSDNNHRR